MHLGHARTALLAWLRARSQGGRIVMRIEDLDPPRVKPGAADAILRDHLWLGLDWDEGPVFQSTRTDAYEAALEQLTVHLVRDCRLPRRGEAGEPDDRAGVLLHTSPMMGHQSHATSRTMAIDAIVMIPPALTTSIIRR